MKWFLILLMLAAGPGFAQRRTAGAERATVPKKTEAAPAKWPIKRLVVEGNHNYTSEQVLAVAGLKIGQMAGKPEFDAARDRLVASGAFETVGYRFEPGPAGEGYVATFQVTEVEPAYPVRFEDLPAQEVEGMLRAKDPLYSKTKLPATQNVLDRYVGWIQEYLAAKGAPEKIMAKVTPVGTDQFAIVFRPARALPVVAQVTFTGNKDVPEDVLRDNIGGVAIGIGYTEDHFRELLDTAVRPAFEARGYMRVKFPQVRAEPAKDVKGLHVFVTVEEGDVYNLSRVRIVGRTPLNPDALLKTAAIKTGGVADFDQVNEGIDRMRKRLRKAGYLNADVTAQRSVDDAKKTVEVALNVEPGPQFRMGKLTIVGLDLNGESEMRRIWGIKEGGPFDPEYPNFFLNRVREEALFDNLGATKADVQLHDQEHTADVTLTFGGAEPAKKPGPGPGPGPQ